MEGFFAETLFIRRLHTECIIGVQPQEQLRAQSLYIDFSTPLSFAQATTTDDIHHTLDYFKVAAEIRVFLAQHRFHLLETLIRQLALHLAQAFGLAELTLVISKPGAIDDCEGPGVSLTYRKPHPPLKSST